MTIEYSHSTSEHIYFFKQIKNFGEVPATISIREFEWWLRREGKLEMVMTYIVDTGHTKDVYTTMTIEEYLDSMDVKEIEKDIAEFITLKTN